jgi:hypothetical protein
MTAKTTWKKIPLAGRIAIIGVGSIGTIYLFNKLFGATNIKPAPVNYGQIPVVYQAGGSGVLWNPDPLAKEIFENIEGANFYTYPDTMAKIRVLNADQAGLLYNHYNEYYGKEYPTLTQLIEAEWTWDEEYLGAIAHLKSFGLNENAKRKPNEHRKKSRRQQNSQAKRNFGFKF